MSINKLTVQWAEENNIAVFFRESTESTNTWAKKEFNNQDFAVFLADHQTQGRGRHQNTWTDLREGRTLLSTWCLRTQSPPQPIFPMRVGLALYEAFAAAFPNRAWSLKAPNDIYMSQGKLAGILIEVEQQGPEFKIFIGIGANILDEPRNVGQPTTSLGGCRKEEWFPFCYQLSKSFLSFLKDSQRQRLTSEEQARLLSALQKYPENQIAQVQSEGSLILQDGTPIHWQDL